jgi:hypothetical protein
MVVGSSPTPGARETPEKSGVSPFWGTKPGTKCAGGHTDIYVTIGVFLAFAVWSARFDAPDDDER